jgi:hypothetical protein
MHYFWGFTLGKESSWSYRKDLDNKFVKKYTFFCCLAGGPQDTGVH